MTAATEPFVCDHEVALDDQVGAELQAFQVHARQS